MVHLADICHVSLKVITSLGAIPAKWLLLDGILVTLYWSFLCDTFNGLSYPAIFVIIIFC